MLNTSPDNLILLLISWLGLLLIMQKRCRVPREYILFSRYSYRTYHIPLPLPIQETAPDDIPEFPPTTTLFPTSYDHIPSVSLESLAPVPLRKSHRQSSKPIWMADYVCHCTSYTSAHCTPSSFALTHIFFVAQLSSMQEPLTYLQAIKDEKLIAAKQQEIQALERNETWEVTNLLAGKRAIGSRWVFKLKLNPDGSIEWYQARLVAKGYTQIEGVNCFDSFSPVAKSISVRVLGFLS
ncbi:UNVERIFIED_CONTAM: Retrovirus-related Pol polyprotein from transposon RE2 [Sesamum latifolium]|uniref:Retrovirus-related Pol polyprotein from transposon RE2 n=1 Tax=Sesamum latifolium TaxID=2727402 RepID=A0AAW2X3A1_9LAMI